MAGVLNSFLTFRFFCVRVLCSPSTLRVGFRDGVIFRPGAFCSRLDRVAPSSSRLRLNRGFSLEGRRSFFVSFSMCMRRSPSTGGVGFLLWVGLAVLRVLALVWFAPPCVKPLGSRSRVGAANTFKRKKRRSGFFLDVIHARPECVARRFFVCVSRSPALWSIN